MNELRWIIAIGGIVLLGAIYLWGRFARRQAADGVPESNQARNFAHGTQVPTLSSEFAAAPPFEDSGDAGIDRLAGKAAAVDLEDEPLYVEPVPAVSYHRARPASHIEPHHGNAAIDIPAPRESHFDDARVEPGLGDIDTALGEPAYRSTRIEPTLRHTSEAVNDAGERPSTVAAPAVSGGPVDAHRKTPSTDEAVRSKPPISRKIVTVRLAAPAQQRYEGSKLRQLLESQSLEHGRYGIFHRNYGGASVFSAASMTEPGTFDLGSMNEERYAGITMFMLLPGPLEGVEAFARMTQCALEAERELGGMLQDERGQPLNEHRFAALREEIVRFQHAFPAPEQLAPH